MPWLNFTGTQRDVVDGPVATFFDGPLCDIDVFQYIEIDDFVGLHRSCPPGISKGTAAINSPPIPISPQFGFEPGIAS